jgi:hypothetical protein
VYGRRNVSGSISSRSQTAACTAVPARASIRRKTTPCATARKNAATADASNTIESWISSRRCAPGISVLKKIPATSGGSMPSADAPRLTAASSHTSRPAPRSAKPRTWRARSGASWNGR